MDILDKLRAYHPTSGYAATMAKAADEIERLRLDHAEAARMTQDAVRYRKLRAGNYSHAIAQSILNDTPHGIDAAVDALPSLPAQKVTLYSDMPFSDARAVILGLGLDDARGLAISLLIQNWLLKKYAP